jgi:cytochrome c
VKRFLALSLPALIALCVVGFAAAPPVAAEHPPAAPSGVTMFSTDEGVLVSWSQDDQPVHVVGWVNTDAVAASGNWLAAFNHQTVTDGNSYLVPGLSPGVRYWMIVGSGAAGPPLEIAWGEWRLITVDQGMALDDALTRAYVEAAVARYDRDGADATFAYYSSEESIEEERYLAILNTEDGIVMAVPFYQDIILGNRHSDAGPFLASATEAGGWLDHRGLHPTRTETGVVVREDQLRTYLIIHDGWLFMSSHSRLLETLAGATQDYVHRAIAHYDSAGLEATVATYNSQDSLDGNFYLFLIGADDNYLVHPIFPHLIGTDIKDVVGSDGQELGKEIALATEEGIWVEYLWPNPVSRVEEPKITWAIRHDGLIFASGYYIAGADAGAQPWLDADPREYTVQYVQRAIERYQRDGLESMLNFYNSVASFEGEWYLFGADANDIYHVHPLLPRLIGTDINDVVGSDGFELGKALAQATEEGVWVEYQWPHPVTLQEVTKVGYAVRHDGLLFASGYYPTVDDPEAHTKAYVQQAIDYYDREGAEAMLAFYNTPASIEGSFWMLIVGPDGNFVASALAPELVGQPASTFRGILAGEPIGDELLAATADGHWYQYVWPNQRASGVLVVNLWIVLHDGYVFSSAYYQEQ